MPRRDEKTNLEFAKSLGFVGNFEENCRGHRFRMPRRIKGNSVQALKARSPPDCRRQDHE